MVAKYLTYCSNENIYTRSAVSDEGCTKKTFCTAQGQWEDTPYSPMCITYKYCVGKMTYYTETFAYYARFLPIVLDLKRVTSYAKRKAGTMCLSLRVKPKTWRISADAISMTTGPKISDELPLTNRINTRFYSMRNALLCNIALSLRRCIKTDSGQL